MNNAIIFIKNSKELELAKAKLLGKPLIEYTVSELKKMDLDGIYLVGGEDIVIEGVINRNFINEVIEDLSKKDGKTLLMSPLYPSTSKNEYLKLLSHKEERGAVMIDNDGLNKFFMLPNNHLMEFEGIDFKTLAIEKSDSKRVNEFADIPEAVEDLKLKINTKLIESGVNIMDPFSTYISQDTTIDKNTIIYPNVVIEGKCIIGKNNVITGGTYLINVVAGDNNNIVSSRVTNSIIHNNTYIGPNAHIRNKSEISDDVKIGNYVEIKNSKISRGTSIAHLAYVGDATVGEFVNIGAGAVTINYDGSRKYPTVIKDHAFIGSNSSLIAPITIGEYAMVAAGSTVDSDVCDGDMAISRLYQTNKKGYGYKYINKEN